MAGQTTVIERGQDWSRTPIWDTEFADRWAALMDEQPPAEPTKGKPRN